MIVPDDFDINKVYEQGNNAVFDGYMWVYVGQSYRYGYQEPSHSSFSFSHIQRKTIDCYPCEKGGWRRLQKAEIDE